MSPYNQHDHTANLERLAETIESLRVEQRKREQQLEQPHQGQHEVVWAPVAALSLGGRVNCPR